MIKINSTYIKFSPGRMKEYCSFSAFSEGVMPLIFQQNSLLKLNSLDRHHVIELKIGFPITLIMDFLRLYNTMKMIIEELHKNHIVAKTFITVFKSDTVLIPRIALNLLEGEIVPLQWTQFTI